MGTLIALLPPSPPPDDKFYLAACAEAAKHGCALLGLYVVDAVWFRFSAADWLSTGPSRADFDTYMRETLRAGGEAMLGRLCEAAKDAGVAYSFRLVEGEPADIVRAVAQETGAEAVIVPADHPALEPLMKSPPCRVIAYRDAAVTA